MFDLVVPVYNSLHHARSCIRSILNCAEEQEYTLYVVDDGSRPHVAFELDRLVRSSKRDAQLITNEVNSGYLASANRGGFAGSNPYIVFINSDTVVPPGFMRKVRSAFESGPDIAVVTAVSNWANWTRVCWAIPPGENIYSMNQRLEAISKQPVVDIDNASGFFFAVRREIFEAFGGFDPVYGAGYWEEADFCMKALDQHKRVVVDETLFVYHHGWGTFQASGRDANMTKNKETFMSRWQEQYQRVEKKWRTRNPISYMEAEVLQDKKSYPDLLAPKEIEPLEPKSARQLEDELAHLKTCQPEPLIEPESRQLAQVRDRPRVIYILPAVKVYGGIISVLQIVNQLILNGIDARVCTWGEIDPKALKLFPMFFSPLKFNSVAELIQNLPECDLVIATSWDSVYPAFLVQRRRPSLQLCYYVQDYEPDFYADARPDLEMAAERTYKMIEQKIAKTRWLTRKLGRFPGQVHRIPLGLNLDYFFNDNRREGHQVLALGRPQSKRRNFDMVKAVYGEIHKKFPDVSLALYGFGYDAKALPFPCRDYGLLTSMADVAGALNDSTILLDCSTFQGFGRPGLEAMACGAFPILTREGGITQYAKHDYNCTLIDPNDKANIVGAVTAFLEDPGAFERHIGNGYKTASEYSLNLEGARTAELFRQLLQGPVKRSYQPNELGAAFLDVTETRDRHAARFT